MVKCPWGCGWEGTSEAYLAHLEKCPYAKKELYPAKAVGPSWKERAAFAIATMIVEHGRPYERREREALAERIEKMLSQFEKEWG